MNKAVVKPVKKPVNAAKKLQAIAKKSNAKGASKLAKIAALTPQATTAAAAAKA